MTTVTLIITILSSSLLTAIFTKIVEYRFSKLNHKREFYNKLIDKRIDAYTYLIETMKVTNGAYSNASGIPGTYNQVFKDWESFDSFYANFKGCFDNISLYSEQLNKKLAELAEFMANVTKENNLCEHRSALEFKAVGVKEFNGFVKFKREITRMAYKDFIELYKVEDFIRKFKG